MMIRAITFTVIIAFAVVFTQPAIAQLKIELTPKASTLKKYGNNEFTVIYTNIGSDSCLCECLWGSNVGPGMGAHIYKTVGDTLQEVEQSPYHPFYFCKPTLLAPGERISKEVTLNYHQEMLIDNTIIFGLHPGDYIAEVKVRYCILNEVNACDHYTMESTGRCDFTVSNASQLEESIMQTIAGFSGVVRVPDSIRDRLFTEMIPYLSRPDISDPIKCRIVSKVGHYFTGEMPVDKAVIFIQRASLIENKLHLHNEVWKLLRTLDNGVEIIDLFLDGTVSMHDSFTSSEKAEFISVLGKLKSHIQGLQSDR
ncbi:MAG: hypothetical protein CL946_06005 [Ectothiorhodospiraceae bacterium]|nr:hypothetical protein [Ectothiorhodospiraceae bacterium]